MNANTEVVTKPLTILIYAVAAVGFTALGIVAAIEGVAYFGADKLITALWLVTFAGASLYIGIYGIGYRRLLSRIV